MRHAPSGGCHEARGGRGPFQDNKGVNVEVIGDFIHQICGMGLSVMAPRMCCERAEAE